MDNGSLSSAADATGQSVALVVHSLVTCASPDYLSTAPAIDTPAVLITRLTHYQVAEELADGRLVRVLRDHEAKDLPIQLVYPHALQLSPRVRAFVEWACPRLEKVTPGPDDG